MSSAISTASVSGEPAKYGESKLDAKTKLPLNSVDVDELQPSKVYSNIADVDNGALTQRDMISLLSATTDQNGLVGHNLDGYNDLTEHGLNRIMTQMYNIDRYVKNERTETADDKMRKSIQIMFSFHDVKVGRPSCTTYLTGQFTDLYPNRARLTGLPYSGPVTLGASVTIRAHYADGRTEDKTAEIPQFQIGGFPIMVGSNRCHTSNCTREALKEMGEDPTDPGTYFVMKRSEFAINLLENIRYNSMHVHSKMKPNEHVRAEFLSQPGGAFENSSQTRVRYMRDGQITIEINSTKFERVRLPFFVIYRLFGMTSDRSIVETIVFDPNDSSPITKHMLDVLEVAFHQSDPTFEPLIQEINREKVVQMTAVRISKYLTNPAIHIDNEAAIQFLNEDLLGNAQKPGSLDSVILPHMGKTAESRIRKLRLLGLIIRKALLVHLGVTPPTDRDSYSGKRTIGAGVSLAKTFKTQVNNSIVTPIWKALKRTLRNNPWTSITDKTLIDTFRNAITSSDLNKAMEQSISSGQKTIVVRRKASTNRLSSQAIERKNGLNTICELRNVVTQNAGNASKMTERADQMRRVHATYIGFICICHSADSGENVGMKKQLAVTTGVCSAGEALPLKLRLLADNMVTALDDVLSAELLNNNLSTIFVNGEWVGVCASAPELVTRYRKLRREGRIVSADTTIYWNPVSGDVEFWLDVGRLRRPIIIVDNNIEEYDAALKAIHVWKQGKQSGPMPEPVEFVQNVRFTPEHVRGIAAGHVTLNDLINDGIVEYITPEEQENCLLAQSIVDVAANRHNVAMQYSHCDVEQAVLGLAAHVSPYGNHTQPARITYETNQGRQTGGWYALNFPFRTDKNRFFQFYNEIPLVRTFTHKLVPSNGYNAMIAYASYGGDNQEDSAIVSKAAADRGLFTGAFFRFELAELEKGEAFGNPDALTTKNLKPNASYEKLDDGFIRVGSIVQYGDVLIGRTAKLSRSRSDDRYIFTDRSVVYTRHEPAFVESVLKLRGASDELFAVVKLRYERPLTTGDKMCLTPEHQVLTSSGWVDIGQITLYDKVATMEDGVLMYDSPTDIHTFDISEDIYDLDGEYVNTRVTMNHRMYVRPDGESEYRFIEARDTISTNVVYKSDAVNNNEDVGVFELVPGPASISVPMDDWLVVFGILLSAGSLNMSRTSPAITIRVRNEQISAQLDDALKNMGIQHSYCAGTKLYTIMSRDIQVELATYNAGTKYARLPEYAWKLSQKQSRILFDSVLREDIIKPLGSHELMKTELTDDLQRLALHAGWSATIVDGHAPNLATIVVNKQGHTKGFSTGYVYKYSGPVHCLTMPAGIFYIRRNGVPTWTGNSSRSGNKAIVSTMLQQSDMPFTENGITPDIIINTHSFPSRMTIGQLIETNLSTVCAQKGAIADGTSFLPVDHLEIAREMYSLGFRYNGRKRMYNGMTGEYFDAAIFMGPTLQQRIQKFPRDDEQSVAGSGPTDATTGQPLGGKNIQGGLKLGPMELWGLDAHGAMLNHYEKTTIDSDGRIAHVCRLCGLIATFNEYKNIYQCRICGEQADLSTIDTTKSGILIHEELAASNISTTLGLQARAPYEIRNIDEK